MMELGDFLRLVSIHKFDLRPKREGYRHYIPLMDFIEVFEKNRLYIFTEQEIQMEHIKGAIQAKMNAQVQPHSSEQMQRSNGSETDAP